MRHPETTTPKLLASLSIAAGTLAAMPAEAAIQVTQINQSFGFSGGVAPPASLTVNLGSFTSVFSVYYATASGIGRRRIAFYGSDATFNITAPGAAENTSFAVPLAYGATPTYTHTSSGGSLAKVFTNGVKYGTEGLAYYAFNFTADPGTGPQTYYGWINATVSIIDYDNFSVTVHRVGYDDTGATVTAGQGDVLVPVPEPASAALLAFGAMTMGAAGLRRFRRQKRASA